MAKSSSIPPQLVCSLSQHLLEDPVRTLYGTVYSRRDIVNYIRRYHACPQTGKPLHLHLIYPDEEVKRKLLRYHKNYAPSPAEAGDNAPSTRETSASSEQEEDNPLSRSCPNSLPGSQASGRRSHSRTSSASGSPHATTSPVPVASPEPTPPQEPVSEKRNRSFSGSSQLGRSVLHPKTRPAPSRSTLSSMSMAAQLVKLPSVIAPTTRWFRRGRNRWKMYNDAENDILEGAYQQGASTVFLHHLRATINLRERLHMGHTGSRRPVIRGMYFLEDSEDWVPLAEDVVEVVEQYYQSGRYHVPVVMPNKQAYVVIKSAHDIRQYPAKSRGEDDDPYIVVHRGFSPSVCPSPASASPVSTRVRSRSKPHTTSSHSFKKTI